MGLRASGRCVRGRDQELSFPDERPLRAADGLGGEGPGGSSPFFLYTRHREAASSPQPDPADERRGAPRVRPSRSARLLDISALGLALETEAEVTKGQVYDLILGLDDHRMPISARAVHVRKDGER